MRQYFIQTKRLGFSHWENEDLNLAISLWGEPEVTRYICAKGVFSIEEIQIRLMTEIANYKNYHVQYYPVFTLGSGELVGCCGFRPFDVELGAYEIGFHLRKEFWHRGFGYEAGTAAIKYGFDALRMNKLLAGHHPENIASRALLAKLGFQYIGDNYYEPTGLYHPSYELTNYPL